MTKNEQLVKNEVKNDSLSRSRSQIQKTTRQLFLQSKNEFQSTWKFDLELSKNCPKARVDTLIWT